MERALDQGSVLPGAALTGCVALGKSLCLSECFHMGCLERVIAKGSGKAPMG